MRRIRALFVGLAVASLLAVIPLKTTSTGTVAINDACAESGSCCPYDGATCWYQPECSGWGPWKNCPKPEKTEGAYWAGDTPCSGGGGGDDDDKIKP